ncbi:MAG: hypothetical protein ACFFG0_00085 [Candidatus Thorarchaeota archaeon]
MGIKEIEEDEEFKNDLLFLKSVKFFPLGDFDLKFGISFKPSINIKRGTPYIEEF